MSCGTGWILSLHVRIAVRKIQAISAVSEGDLLFITLPKSLVDNSEREIKVGDHLYDIFGIEEHGDSVRLTVHADREEEQMQEEMSALFRSDEQRHIPNFREHKENAPEQKILPQCPENSGTICIAISEDADYFSVYTVECSDYFGDIFKPPPDLAT